MTEEEIKNGNYIIDKYMGNLCDLSHIDWNKYSVMFRNAALNRINNPIKYHLSWDYLMPVVYKVSREIEIVKIKTDNIDKSDYDHQLINTWQKCINLISKKHIAECSIKIECDECWGSGWETQFVKPCSACKGTGKINKTSRF